MVEDLSTDSKVLEKEKRDFLEKEQKSDLAMTLLNLGFMRKKGEQNDEPMDFMQRVLQDNDDDEAQNHNISSNLHKDTQNNDEETGSDTREDKDTNHNAGQKLERNVSS